MNSYTTNLYTNLTLPTYTITVTLLQLLSRIQMVNKPVYELNTSNTTVRVDTS
jgi:hypothetical protein